MESQHEKVSDVLRVVGHFSLTGQIFDVDRSKPEREGTGEVLDQETLDGT